jgi:hypothetical protein
MKILFDEAGSLESLKNQLDNFEVDRKTQGFIVFACDQNGWQKEDIDPILKAMNKPLFGGVFPQIIYQNKSYYQGTLILAISHHIETIIIKGLSDPKEDYETQLKETSARWQGDVLGNQTVAVIVDGFSKRIATLVQSLFFCFGLEENFIGGGAGSLTFQQKPCIITNEGLLEDVAVIAHMNLKSGIGVAHGWQPMSESMKVTDSDGNIIKSLNWRNAMDVYRELIKKESGYMINQENFFEIAKNYPLGIGKLGAEMVVRDPIRVDENGGLVCVGEMPKGCSVRILKGSSETLIEAAGKARLIAEQSFGSEEKVHPTILCMDCISRRLFLEDKIEDELMEAAGSYEMFGALSMGEIANNGRDYLEFYNKTIVIGIFSEVDDE